MNSRAWVLLPRTGVYPGFGQMLVETLSGLGWHAAAAHRATAEMLEADLLLVAGQARNVDGLSAVLRRREGGRPFTVLWQLEPLPPVELSAEGEAIGLRAAALDWGRLPAGLRRVLNVVVPFRTRLLRTGQAWLARPYSRRVLHEPEQQGWKRYQVNAYVMAMAEWRWIRNARACGWIDQYFASTQPRVEFLKSRGIETEWVPVGYHRGWGEDLHLPRDVNVLFLGRMDPGPRGQKLRRLEEQLRRRGRALTLVRGVYGRKRSEWLSRARIALSLVRVPYDLAGMRVIMAMGCGALVISESCLDTGAFEPGRHYVMADLDKMPDVIEHYLTHELECRKIAADGQRFVTQELTLANMVRRILARVAVGATR